MGGFDFQRLESVLGWRIWLLRVAFCLAVVCGVNASGVGAQEYGVQSWQRQHGLPENMVKALCQTHDGYLWIGTYSGLARFDGFKFTVFNHLNLPGLPSDVCKALAEDTAGNLWIGTDKGLVRWNRRRLDVFTTRHGLSGDDIRLLCVGQQDRLWIATSQGLDRFSEGTFTRFTARDGLRLDFVAHMYEDPSGALWISSVHGVQWWNAATAKFDDCVNYVETKIGPWSNCALGGRQDTLWLGRVLWPENGLARLAGFALLGCTNAPGVVSAELVHASPGRLFSYTNEPGIASGLHLRLVPDRRGNVWMATGSEGLLQFQDGQFTHYGRPHGLSDESLQSLLEDREGNLWIGTRYGGLNRLQPRRFQVYGTNEGLPHEKAWTMCERRDGGVWLGTDDGVTLWRDGCLTNYTGAHGLTNAAIRSLHEDRDGILWIGTGKGLFSLRDGAIASHPLVAGYAMHKIRVINSDRAGDLWVGWENGLLRLRESRWQNFTTNDGLSCNDIRAVLEDRHGALWLGTFGGGLNRWHEGKVTVLSTKDGLASDFAWTLYEDADGVLWIGTERGLCRYQAGRLTNFTTREGLFDNLINQILEDDRGYLWLSCDRGIFRVSKLELNDVAQRKTRSVQSVAYGEADGLLSAETNGRKSQPAGCKTRDGRLWFPTSKGVAVIDPGKLDYDEVPPPVVIEEVHANGQLIFGNDARNIFPSSSGGEGWGEGTQLVAKDGVKDSRTDPTVTSSAQSEIGKRKSEIRLPPGAARLLAFHYTANCLAAPEKVRFKYRLLGSHSEWIEAGTRRVAHYTDLRPGHYRYQVIACNQHSVWNDTGASLAFYLAPFFYQTSWFYAMCGVLVLLAAFAGHRVRLGVVQRLKELQKAKALAEARLHISRDLHEKLGAKLTHLALLSDSLQSPTNSPAHEDVAAMARDTVGDLGDLVWAVDPRCDSIESFASYLAHVAEDYCEEKGMACSFDMPNQFPDVPLPTETRHALVLAVKDILRAAAGSRHGMSVAIRVALETDTFVVVVEARHDGAGTAPIAAGDSQITAAAQRVQAIGGSFDLLSSAANTSRITLRVGINQL